MLMQLPKNAKILKTFCDQRIKQNRNVIILIDGETGTGKTLAAFRLGIELDQKGFSKEFITQDADNILNLFRKIAEDKEKHRGRVVIYEETQEDMLKGGGATIEAKAIIKLLSKFRYLCGILILTTPHSSHLNKYLMDYIDIHLHTEEIFYRRKICRVKIKFGRWVESKQKRFWEFMRVQTKGSEELFKLEYLDLVIPPQEVIDYYEGKKDNFFIESMQRDTQRIDKKYNKKKAKTYPQKCSKCSYEWAAMKESPKKCPACQTHLSYN